MRNALSLENLTGIFRVSSKEPSRIINREGTTIEFKESYNHGNMAQYFKAMAAFANNQGGYILFGIGDKPRRLIGLKDKSLSQFEELKVEDFTKALLDYFSPEIKWEHCTFEFHGMSFGVIYVYPLLHKPCICKKHYDAQNAKYSLKEGDIYYRYGGRSERIRYTELASIIDEARKNEERQWLNFAKRAVRIGVSNAALLDLKSGNLSGTSPVCALCEAGSPNTRIFGLFCVTPFRTRGCTPCAAKRLSLRTCYLRTILTNHSQIASMIERSIYEARHGACSAHSFEN